MLDLKNSKVEEVLRQNGQIVACTSGTSMYPMLRNRKDMVVIEKCQGKLGLHDVPLYRTSKGKLVLHRVIKVTENGYVIRGDNLYKNEYGVKDSDIIGVLKTFYRNGKAYNCETDKRYKLYVLFIRISYPVRYVFIGKIRPILGKIKHFLLKKRNGK